MEAKDRDRIGDILSKIEAIGRRVEDMSVGTVTFSIPGDEDDIRTALDARKVKSAIWEFDQWLRKQHKYSAGEIDLGHDMEDTEAYSSMQSEAAWQVRQKFHEILDDYEVSID